MNPVRGPWRVVQTVLVWAVGLVLLFEEWGWEPLARWLARIGQWPGLRWIESAIRRLPPWAALSLFALPLLGLLPLKLVALYWLGKGQHLLGITVIVLAKVGGTAASARLFTLTQPALMRLAWFARGFRRWMAFKTRVIGQVHATLWWHTAARLRQGLQRGWRALRRRMPTGRRPPGA